MPCVSPLQDHPPIDADTRQARLCIVRVEAASFGPTGFGYTYAGTSGARMLFLAITELLAPVLIGRDAEAYLDFEASCTRSLS